MVSIDDVKMVLGEIIVGRMGWEWDDGYGYRQHPDSIVQDGFLAPNARYQLVRKASTIRRADVHNSAMHEAIRDFESRAYGVLAQLGYERDETHADGRCVWSVIHAIQNGDEKAFWEAFGYFEKYHRNESNPKYLKLSRELDALRGSQSDLGMVTEETYPESVRIWRRMRVVQGKLHKIENTLV